MCPSRHLLPVQPVYFTSSHWEAGWDQVRGRVGITWLPSVCPHNDGNALQASLCCSSPSQAIFPAAGSYMNSAVHVPPSPPSACVLLYRKADFSPNFAAMEPLPQAREQLTAWHAVHYSHQLQHSPARFSWLCWQLHREAVSGFMRVPGVLKTLISGHGRRDLTLGGDSNSSLALTKGQS